jgi:hypothetical protein
MLKIIYVKKSGIMPPNLEKTIELRKKVTYYKIKKAIKKTR